MRERQQPVDALSSTEILDHEPRHHVRRPLRDLVLRCREHAVSRGRSPAVLESRSGRRCTYAELEERSRLLARKLLRRGVGCETGVGVLLERGIELVIASLAIWRAGGVYIPLDPRYPHRRLDAMVSGSRPHLLITTPELARPTGDRHWKIPNSLPCLLLETDHETSGAGGSRATGLHDRLADPPLRSGEQAAVILFTSGTAGRPKGVVIPHRALAWYCDNAIEHYGLSSRDRLLQLASISFDISLGEIYPTLAAGATVVIDDGPPGEASELLARCRHHGITVLFPATALWHELARAVARDPKCLPDCIRLISFGGEKVSPARLEDWLAAIGEHPVLINGYGPTETTVELTRHRLERGIVDQALLIGRPVSGVVVEALGPDGLAVDTSQLGELVASSPGISRGYLGDAALTAARFVPDPRSSVPGARRYRTGDLGRWRDDRLELAGRIDQQVKFRGLRLELSEIEHLLEAHPRVAAAAAVVVEDPVGGTRQLVAFVVESPRERGVDTPESMDGTVGSSTDGSGILGVGGAGLSNPGDPAVSTRQLREHLRLHLAAPLVPARFLSLSELPRSPAGKIDRPTLRRLARDAFAEGVDGEPEDVSTIAILEHVWRRTLGISEIDPDEDFFALGGDSILALRLVSEGRRHGLELSARVIFAHPTLRRLADWLDAERQSDADSSTLGATRGQPERADDAAATATGRGWAPLTPVQHWFFDRLVIAEPDHFNQSMHLLPSRRLDGGCLRRAVARLVEHHAALRHRFFFDGGWRQRAARRETAELVLHADLSRLASQHRIAAHRRLATAVQKSLALTHGPVLRLALIELDDGRQRLLIVIHHLVVDGVSWTILLDDLERLYLAEAGGRKAEPLQESLPYLAWARVQQRHASSATALAELRHWLAQPPRATPLPCDHRPGREDNTFAAEQTRSVGLDPRRSQLLLRTVPRVYGNRINDILLAAVVLACAPWTGSRELLIDLEGHGREDIEPGLDLSRTVGWLTATFPVHLRLPTVDDPGSVLRAMRDQLSAVPRHGIGHGILYDLSPDPAVRGRLRLLPHAEISFNYLGQLDSLFEPRRLFGPAAEPRGRERSERGLRPYLVEIDGGVVGGRLWMNWHYGHRLHRPTTITRLAHRFLRRLEHLIDHCVQIERQHRYELVSSRPEGSVGDGLPAWVVENHPTTPLQEGILFHCLLGRSSSLYCELNSWQLTGDLSIPRFLHAWRLLLERHATLRSAFAWRGLDRPRQVVARHVDLPWHTVDLRALATGARSRVEEHVLENARRPGFALDRPPLLRLLWIELGPETFPADRRTTDTSRAVDPAGRRQRRRFAWIAHHLLLDGWSLASLFDELFELYHALGQGRIPEQPPRLALSVVSERLAALDHRPAEKFFRAYLADCQPDTPFGSGPFATTARSELENKGQGRPRQLERRLDRPTSDALAHWAAARGLTLATVLQGLWGMLLARRAGRSEAMYGLVVNGRSPAIEGIETTIGLLINTLPVRLRLAPGDPRLLPWLEALQTELGELRRFEQTPLAKIRRWAGLEGRQPLFEYLFGFQNYPLHHGFLERDGEVEIGAVRSTSEVHYPLVLAVLPEERLTLQLSWNPTRLTRLDARRLLHQLTCALVTVAAGDETLTVSAVPWLDAGEKHQLLVEWNPPPLGVPSAHRSLGLLQRLARHARQTPRAPAILQTTGRETLVLSYGELVDRIARLARRWRDRGLAPEQRVILLFERSPEQIVALLACLAAGAVFVPLDPRWPEARWLQVVRRSGARWLVADETPARRLGDALAATTGRALDRLPREPGEESDDDRDARADGCRALPESPEDAQRLAYVLFTSGSTGEPKGVMIRHGGLDNLVADRTFGTAPGDTMLQLASPGFDASVWEIAEALGHGAALRLLPPGPPPAGTELAELLAAAEISHALVPPSWLATLSTASAERLPGLRRLLVGGEPCPPELARRWAVGRTLINAYGPTETTVCATAMPLAGELERVRIGRPLRGIRVHLVGPWLELLPIGWVGELVIAGHGLARGYLDDPAGTATRFVPDPFADTEHPGARLYRTGDLGRRCADGTLEMLGRHDQQVKIRGVRVELGEIEQALTELPVIAQAAVVCEGRAGTPDLRLVAHVVLAVDSADTASTMGSAAEWRSILAERLPVVMVPDRLHVHRRLPRLASGKLDRAALLKLGPGDESVPSVDGADEVEPALDPVEDLLAGLWREVLAAPTIDRRSNFFELGGHSLLATQLVSRIGRVFEVDLPLRVLFDHPTLAQLAREVARRRAGELGVLDRPPLEAGRRGERIPASFAQERLWFLHRLAPGDTTYNVPRAYRLRTTTGLADTDRRFERALAALIARHEVLRTRLRATDGRPEQEVVPPPRRVLARIDLAYLPKPCRPIIARRLLEREAERPFALERGPLWRFLWLRLGRHEAWTLLHFHHVVFDGWSLGILHRDLARLFRPANDGARGALPRLSVQYADFACWQRRWLDEATIESQVELLCRRMGGRRVLERGFDLPLDHPRRPHPTGRGRYLHRPLPDSVAAALNALARRHDATLYMALLAVFALLLARLAGRGGDKGSRRVVLGSPIAQRNRRETEGLIGFFVNSLVLAIDTRTPTTLCALVRHVRELALGAFDLQDLPFERLVEKLRPERSTRHPLFQISFALQNTPNETLELDGLEVDPVELEHPRIRFELEVFFRPCRGDHRGTGLELLFGSDAELFDATTTERWSRALSNLLQAAAGADDETPLDALPWWSPAERQQLLWEWPLVALPTSGVDAGVDAVDPWTMFCRAVERAPDGPALVVPASLGTVTTETWTFAELEARARRLGRRLRQLGVGVEAPVVVELERSPALLVALLATLSCGGVFVAIDPDDPAPRRNRILARLSPRARLCSESRVAETDDHTIPTLALRTTDGHLADAPRAGRRTRHTEARHQDLSEEIPGDALAYLLHTSGSTGEPKGVAVSRRALAEHLRSVGRAYRLESDDRALWLAAPGFDVGLEQTLAPLVHGATVVLGTESALEPTTLARLLESARITVANLTPSLWSALVRASHDGPEASPRGVSERHPPSPLRLMIVGGDTMPAAALDPWRRSPWGGARLLNAYGPTEAVITATLEPVGDHPVSLPPGVFGLPVGRPLAGRSARILGTADQPPAVGGDGELFLGGEILARGYHDHPAVTAERFVPDPLAVRPGARRLRSGDRARFDATGRLMLGGRLDRQLQVHGRRIEPGEIESALRCHQLVDEARVEARPGESTRRLVAWVAIPRRKLRRLGRRRQVEHWRAVYEDLHREPALVGEDSPDDRFRGWVDSISGRAIPRHEMEDWLDQTRDRVLALGPSRLLEIGCGHGLLLAELEPHVESLMGTDFSPAALERLERDWLRRGLVPPRLLCRRADDFRGLESAELDTVVLSSVAQYFPDVEYLLAVLGGAVDRLATGGALYLGDLRSLPLLPLLYTVAEAYADPQKPGESDTRDTEALRRALARRRALERELVLDPLLFLAFADQLPRARALHLRPKRQRFGNELIRYRFDLSLWLDRPPERLPEIEGGEASREDELLLDTPSAIDRLAAILVDAPERLHLVVPADARGAGISRSAPAWSALRRVLARHPYFLEALWTREHGARLLLVRHPEADHWPGGAMLDRRAADEERNDAEDWRLWATEPARDLAIEHLVPELRSTVEARLPRAMVPRDFVILDRLPRTSHGKIDSPALPPPTDRTPRIDDLPRDATEQRLARRWCELLGLPSVGIHTPFFHLGGHSLLATRLVAWIRRRTGVDIPLRWFFEHPTLAELASRIEAEQPQTFEYPITAPTASTAVAASVAPDGHESRSSPIPLSHAQERLWFLDQLEPCNPAYHLSHAFELEGPLVLDALRRAFDAVVARHEILRTRFPDEEGRPRQEIAPRGPGLAVVELAALPVARRSTTASDIARSLRESPFDLACGPLARFAVLRLEPRRHQLVMTQHHIVSDGWSLSILHQELTALYRTFTTATERTAERPRADPLPPPPLQYADFAIAERRATELAADPYSKPDADLEYWRRQLSGLDELTLPTDRPHALDAPSSGGATFPLRIDPALGRRLGELGRRHGTSTFRVLLAAFGELLRRLTGQDELAIGTPVAHRDRPELERLIGFFVDTLVLRLRMAPNFDALIAVTRDTVEQAFAHRRPAFDSLVEVLAPRRRPGRNPFFQVTFALHDFGPSGLELQDLSCRPLDLELRHVHFELELHLWPDGEALEGFFAFRRQLFDLTTVHRFARCFGRLLRRLVERPGEPLAGIGMLGPAERHQLAYEWGGRDASDGDPPANDDPLMRRLDGWQRRAPSEIAIEQGEERLTRAELARHLAGLGRRLRAAGVDRGSVVAVCCEPSVDAVVAQLALWRCGAVYVPLDPSFPRARLAGMVERSRARRILVDTACRSLGRRLADDTGIAWLAVDRPGHQKPAEPPGFALPPPLDSAAYCLYTSGSTGIPKAVVVSRRAFVTHLEAMARAQPLRHDDRVVQKTAPGFDPALWETWAPLLAGARLVIAETRARHEPVALCRLVERHGVTVLRSSPSLLRLLVNEPTFARCRTLRRILCGGEVLSPALVERYHRHGPRGARLVNVYGPTEATINSTAHPLDTASPTGVEHHAIPLGRVLPGLVARVVDPRLGLLPPGVEGEIVLGGAGLARGYEGEPGQTAAVFVPDPWASPTRDETAGRRLYRTGDRARWSADGRLVFLGRRDGQVKLRGYRVELGEIETRLTGLPDLREGAVSVRSLPGVATDEPPIDLLVAFVVCDGVLDDDRIASWRSSLRASLPDFMIPSHWVALDRLPRGRTGKLDRRALSHLALGHRQSARVVRRQLAGDFANNPRLEILHEIWCQVLDRRRIAPDDDFFALGGHSLLATQVVSRIRRALEVDVSLAGFFRHPTLEELATSLAAGEHGPIRVDTPIPRRRTGDRRVLSLAQRRLWFLAQLDPTDASYNMPIVVELRGRLDARALSLAWRRLVARHEILRTVLPARAGRPYQEIRARGPELVVIELATLRDGNRSRQVAYDRSAALADRPFDLTRGPLTRPVLLRLDTEHHLLSLTLHHCLADGWSKGVLLRELSLFYQAARRNEDAVLPPLVVQYADYAEWQKSRLDGPTLDRLADSWCHRLAGSETPRLPTDGVRTSRRGSRGAAIPIRLGLDVVEDLRQRGRESGATLFMTTLTVFMAWLHRLTGQSDIRLATPIANRHRPELESLVGFFVNTLILRGDFSGRPSFAQALTAIRRFALEAFDEQELPFDHLVAAMRPERELGRNPLSDVAFALRYPQEPLPPIPGLEMVELALPSRHVQFELDLDLWSTDEGIEGLLAFRSDLFDRTTVARWRHQIEILAAGLARSGETLLHAVPLLAAAERHQLLMEWRTPASAPQDRGRALHCHILDHARRRPEAPAILWPADEDRLASLDYGQLSCRALLLAEQLQSSGVKAETRVGIFLPKSAEAVTAIVAVMAAGGAWVPLDPQEPELRLAAMAEQLELRFVLTSSSWVERLPWRPPVVILVPSISGGEGTTTIDEEHGRRLLDDRRRWARAPGADGEPGGDPLDERLAYIVQTSGSTGHPKAVAVSHRAWATVLEAWRRDYRLAGLRRHLQAARMMFDVFAGDLARALGSGAALVLCPLRTLLDPDQLAASVRRYRIDMVELVPSVARQLAESVARSGGELEGLKWLLVGSEVFPRDDLSRLRQVLTDDCRLVNSYGASEATIDSTWYLASDPATTARRRDASVPVGRPFPGVATVVVDRDLHPLPIGVAGELTLAGPLARGYLGDPARTARCFVPDPFSPRPGGRLYRSGDRARWRSDGMLELLGRLDRQVKIRGLRIEPAEIEAVLERLSDASEVAVVATDPASGYGPRLAAFLAPSSEIEPSVTRLRERLGRHLPEAMIPTDIEWVEALPRTPDDAIDRDVLRRRLELPEAEKAHTLGAPPRGDDEQILAAIWRELLGREVGREADFFAFGGHSLLAVRLVAEVSARFKIRLPVAEVFEHPRLRDLARLIARRRDAPPPDSE